MNNILEDIETFLPCPTPGQWVINATNNIDLLLIDHANCEKKAAVTALNLIHRYTENFTLLNKMSRLAREEMRHFEQVISIMQERRMVYRRISASRYAKGLLNIASEQEPYRLVDRLIIGAFIEARSCERFAMVAPILDDELKLFYRTLLKSEGRHFREYLMLAESVLGKDYVDNRKIQFSIKEKDLIQSPDDEFRFHSGPI